MKNGQMLPWGQAARRPPVPSSLFPWPVLSSSHSLQHLQLEPKLEPKVCICLRPCFSFLSQNPGALGEGAERLAWREENGELEGG